MEDSASLTHSPLILGARLGSGASSYVHQAQYGDQPCVAKAFFVSRSELVRQTVNKEISILQRLRFRHVIQFYRTHEQDNRIYILMELAEKGSLEHAITKGSIDHNDWTTKTRLAHEIARGLAYIHHEGVLHRDLNSNNVLLTKHMEVKLANFGLAQARSIASAVSVASGKESTRAAGSVRWVAPELLCVDKPACSAKSDVYALGVVMWEMAADCTVPFKDQHDDASVALDVQRGRREQLPEDTPTEYRDWVERCWAQDPSDRPNASSVILVHDQTTKRRSNTNGSLLGRSRSAVKLLNAPESHSIGNERVGLYATPEYHDDHLVGCLPQTDDDVVTYFCKAAKAEDTDAQLFLGWIYGHGRGVDKSERDSFWWYHKAAEGGNVVAQLQLARMYEGRQGIGAINATKAAMWYRKAANGGNAEAQHALGRMYTDGCGVKENTFHASIWYLMAAKQGHHEAQTILGQWFALGRGVVQSDEEAIRWLTMAAEQGNPTAQRRLGHMYLDSQGLRRCAIDETKQPNKTSGTLCKQHATINQNLEKAFMWFTVAAEQGCANAQYDLGSMYLQGHGVEQSDVEAAKWFNKAAEQGDINAQSSLGLMYEYGRGVEQSDIEAANWYTKAADQGDIRVMYEQGRGVEQSDVEAVKWFIKVATQGHTSAQNSLGSMYAGGRGVEQSDVEAVDWFIKAADQEDASAQNNLGLMYARGRGVMQSDDEAIKWYTKAAEQGHANAQNSLGWRYDLGHGVEQSDVEAAKWYSRSAAQHNECARFNLASMYELGLVIDPSDKGPLPLYQEATTRGEPNAHFHVQWLTSSDYLNGRTRTDAKDIFRLYSRGAKQRHAAAQLGLGRMYERGLGVKQDKRTAIVWYGKATAQGHTDAAQRMEFLKNTAL
ncbi:hypothetical protein DFQ27_003423 [Actinomortierella ambigua]|uniref:Protein kinase domain-containing protein n=1 Tax=Actinomortierella ambigua TaxID=1343610 RepID=A0A9P6Q6X5_9FUNG|nr:hypothetical protein DFQ27_003423 [Actinomortierella ambigua]